MLGDTSKKLTEFRQALIEVYGLPADRVENYLSQLFDTSTKKAMSALLDSRPDSADRLMKAIDAASSGTTIEPPLTKEEREWFYKSLDDILESSFNTFIKSL